MKSFRYWQETKWMRKGVYETVQEKLAEGMYPVWILALFASTCVIGLSTYLIFDKPAKAWNVPFFLFVILIPALIGLVFIVITCVGCHPKYQRNYVQKVITEYEEGADESKKELYVKAKTFLEQQR